MPELAPLAPDLVEKLGKVSAATVTGLLARRGLRRATIFGARPIVPGTKMVGEAFTLRYIPAREDLDWTGTLDNLTDAQRVAIERVGPGQVLVMDARGDVSSGGLGAILATRLKMRGAAGVVTDGAVRDYVEIGASGLPAFCRAPHPGANKVIYHPADFGLPIGCGGVAVYPGDVLVGDDDGVVVIPRHLAAEIADEGVQNELKEEFVMARVRAGASIVGTYPLDDAGLRDYEAWRAARRNA
ncbi:MAG TPA: ribonuclease activity regulator RraA [Chloroflexota bacterium]|nr:ribonuclease activity regulator RraA [Chloroflexota bacterium]